MKHFSAVLSLSGVYNSYFVCPYPRIDSNTYTIALMKRFYQHLVEGSNKDTALRQAKLDLIKEFGDQALPVYRAGFTLMGDGSTRVFN